MAPCITKTKFNYGQSSVSQLQCEYQVANGSIIHLRRRQSSAERKTTLFCLHPAPYGGGFFESFLPHLSPEVEAIAPDLPGFGRSSALAETPTIALYAETLADIICQQSDTVSLLGYHTGAMVAIELAASRPDLVDRLILPGVPYFDKSARDQRKMTFMAPGDQESFNALSGLWDMAVAKRHEDIPFGRAISMFKEAVQSHPNAWQGFRAVFDYGVEERLKKITVPTLCLLVAGALAEPTRSACAVIEHAALKDMTHLGANPFERAPKALADAVSSFLNVE